MHYKMKPFYPKSGSNRRPLANVQSSPQASRQMNNDLRCMPVYEELDNNTAVQRARAAAATNVSAVWVVHGAH